MTAAVLAAVRARILAGLPGIADVTGDPHQRAPSRLPAFAAALALVGSEPAAMGGGRFDDYELRLALWPRGYRPPDDPSADLAAVATAVLGFLTAEPADLGGLVWSISPAAHDADIEAGETRQGRLDVTFDLRVYAPGG